MKRFALCLLVAACAPSAPYGGQPQYAASPAQPQASQQEMDKIEDRLSAYLVKQGYDKRDFRPLGLWPQDPDWRTSAN